MLRVAFMGTPDFAVPSLQRLLQMPDIDVVAVLTQPDRPAGRGRAVVESPVKAVASAAHIPILQPRSLRKDPASVERLREFAPDLIIVAAYGLILPPSVLAIPRLGNINVHASLLTRWRGAAPITFAILEGDTTTGVTIMLMDEGMDTGAVLTQAEETIRPDDTTGSLSERLSQTGAELLAQTLPRYVVGEIEPQAQPSEGVTYTRLIKKEDGAIDWRCPAAEIERMVRAYQPWPTAYTLWNGAPLKVLRASVVAGRGEPGEVVTAPGGVAVVAGDGALRLDEVQPAGKRPMPGKAFVNGAPGFVGARLAAVAQER